MLGFLFLILARENEKNLLIYFCIGFFFSLSIRIVYLIIYGFFTDFNITGTYNQHKNYSIALSILGTYILYKILKKNIKTERQKREDEVEDIGEK